MKTSRQGMPGGFLRILPQSLDKYVYTCYNIL